MTELPSDARREAGFELFEVQKGKQPSDYKPMPSIGAGVYEIRVHTRLEHRVLYVARYEEAVYVLHVFEKRTRKTSDKDIAAGRRRLREMNLLRQEEGRR